MKRRDGGWEWQHFGSSVVRGLSTVRFDYAITSSNYAVIN